MTLALQTQGIDVRYGQRLANRGVDFAVETGSIHALVGENGAGKSTLMHVVGGLVTPSAGSLRIEGHDVTRFSPHEAVRLGVGLVHQHVMLVPSLTVAENVVLGAEPAKFAFAGNLGLLDREMARQKTRELSQAVGVPLDPDRRASDLSLGERQALEIVKVLYRGARILLLDEPTAVLTPPEVERFFQVLTRLRDEGRTIVIVTHRLDEVMDIATGLTVLRHGRLAFAGTTAGRTVHELGRLVVGDTELPEVERPAVPEANLAPRLRIEGLRVERAKGHAVVDDVTLEVRPGEILGLAGVEGNGQDALIECLAGLRPVVRGRILLDGQDVTRTSVRQRREAGIGHVPEDRRERGLVVRDAVAANAVLGDEKRFARKGFMDDTAVLAYADVLVRQVDIRPPDATLPALALSGGNQQKVVVAREVGRSPRVLLCAQPTRGVDLGAMARIHKVLTDFARQGGAVILLSADLGELLALSHRIAVFRRGKVAELLRPQDTDARSLGACMVGATSREVAP
ncbi:MAG: ABC transporter ATP-binding protein [Myxococcota bacterium]